jgi:DNA-binding SARP family transcriptional activator
MGLAIYLLGKPRVERGGSVVPAPRGQKVWALLGYLLRSGTVVSRRHLAELLFADAEDPQAALRWNLSELRKLLGVPGLTGNMLRLEQDPTTYVDVFALTQATWSLALRVPGIGQLFLEGLHLTGCAAFEVWLETERRHLQATSEAVLREAALAHLATGKCVEAVDLASLLVRQNPLDEDYQVLLVRCLAAAGDGVGAARQATICRELFMRELGVQPGAALDAAMNTATATPTARPATGRMAAIAQMEAGEAAIGAGVLDAGLQCLRRAVVEADATGDPVIRTRARVALGGALVHAARGRDEEGATALHEALAIGEGVCPSHAAAASRELGYVEFLRGRYERSLVLLRQADSLAGEDLAEQTRIAILHGSVLSDTAQYGEAKAMLRQAIRQAEAQGDKKQLAYAHSMLGRALLLNGDLQQATLMLDASIALAQQLWTAFLPWPQSLRAEVDMVNGKVDAAGERFEHAFALGCQLGDPCWEGIAGRGLGCIAMSRGDTTNAIEILLDAIARSTRLPDGYLWAKAYALEALCGLAISERMPEASIWIDELQGIAARSGMREFTVRALMHRASLGDPSSAEAARLLSSEVDNPVLSTLVRAPNSLLFQ